ncbi:MAG TPA: baseplate J/gp47 family protein [Mycobacterium sp.]|nr:baseplate J/gp47 family protein [Mycobacterium sp.]
MNPAPPTRDRRAKLLAPGSPGPTLNGIDYIEVAPNQTQLFVHFLNPVPVEGTPSGGPLVTISGGKVITTVDVDPGAISWSVDDEGRPVMAIQVAGPGDFSTYQLTINSASLDPFFGSASFTFKANCPTTLDCAAAAPPSTQQAPGQVPIDYLAKDFASFRQALSEFSTLRYGAWVERSEADVGVMLMEALAAMADELSYYQDRVWAESTIQTATQRLSVTRHARLVDYEPAPATVATTFLQLDVLSRATINTAISVHGLGADGSLINFEIEDPAVGLAGTSHSSTAPAWKVVDPHWNRGKLIPYYWDDSQRYLLAGSTVFYVKGHGLGLGADQQLLLDSPAADSADPNAREFVTVKSATPTSDLLFGNVALTEVTLKAPTTADHDLYTTVVAGNIVPAVQGIRYSDTFTIPDPAAPPGPVVVRAGANSTPEKLVPDYRYCLAAGPLAWLATAGQQNDTAVAAQPELVLTADDTPKPWTFTRSLLDATNTEPAFTLTPEKYSPVLTSNRVAWNGLTWTDATWFDYDGDDGTTIRFGDGTFGASPQPGRKFTVLYRVGDGVAGNVPADTIVTVAPGQPQGSNITACTNPFAAAGGTDAETIAQVRNRAPQRFRAQPLRAVQAADYAGAVQSVPGVQQAGTRFRWTGSWLTVFTTADPKVSEEPTVDQLTSLTQLLDRRRLAGYESYLLPPSYVSVDLQITVCGQPTAYASDVQAAVLTRLQPGRLPGGATGFFDHSLWSFGAALESSALLAAIQSCQGVVGVYRVQYRERGVQLDWAPLPQTLTFAPDQILRVDNDPSRPEAGSLRVTVEGSK